MMRLALLTIAITTSVNATTGIGYSMFGISDAVGDNSPAPTVDLATDSNLECKDGGASVATGTTTNPTFGADTYVKFHKMFVMDVCYNTDSNEYLPMGLPLGGGVITNLITDDATDGDIMSVKFSKAATTNIINLIVHDDANCANAAANSPGLPVTAGDGFQCGSTTGSLTTGYETTDNDNATDDAFTANGWYDVTYIKVNKDTTTTATTPAGQTCTTAVSPVTDVSEAYLAVAADYNTAHGTMTTWANKITASCYQDDALAAGTESYQTMCDKETGDIVYSDYATVDCTGASTDKRFNSKNANECTAWDTNVNLDYDAADVLTVCANPAGTATAQYFKGYLVGSSGTCATHDGQTASQNDGTRDVIIGVCYTNQAADGRMSGWQGPFSAGTAGTEPVAVNAAATEPAGGSYKFSKESSGHIGVSQWTSPDCSGTAADTQLTDDPADGAATDWACDAGTSTKLTHGGVLTSGNSAQLQTASYYLTVRQHADDTATGTHNMGGTCWGIAQPASGQRVDYFILDQCHQSAAAASYKWACDTTVTYGASGSEYYAITYETFAASADCTGTGSNYLRFTQTSFNSCGEDVGADACVAADLDTSVETTTYDCGSCATATSKTEATCEALASANTWTPGTCTNVNGAITEYGGKCLQLGAAANDDSWEILTDNTTWKAMCGPAASSSDSDDSDSDSASSAGKIAATAAAAAAAAALLI